MYKKCVKDDSLSLFQDRLEHQLDPSNKYYRLANALPWEEIEVSLSGLYSHTGRPAKSIRLMVSLLLLKYLENISDERVVEKWSENPYWQYFGGEEFFSWEAPCDDSELVYFRKRIGKEGVEKLLSASVGMHNIKGDDHISIDTTVQEKNITYPTDAKLYNKIIGRINKLAKEKGLKLRQTYVRVSKKLLLTSQKRRNTTRKGAKEKKAAIRKLRTIAGRVLRDISRKLSPGELKNHVKSFELYWAVFKSEASR